jgi:hypothetical protein
MKKNHNTIAATLVLLAKSKDNEEKLEKNIAQLGGKATTKELMKKLKWTNGKVNSTIYRLKNKQVVRYKYIEPTEGKIMKEITLIPYTEFVK